MATLRYGIILLLIAFSGAAFSADRQAADAYLAGVPALITGSDYKTIEDLCKRSLQADESFPMAHYYMGLCFEKAGKSRDAFKEYQNAAAFAAKEKDSGTAAKASAAAKKLGTGLMEIDALDQKLAERLTKIGAESIDLGRMETAKQTYAALLILQPDNVKAKEGLEKATKWLSEHGNPIKTKIAAAMLTETLYKLGTGKKDEAAELAKTLSQKYSDTEWGKEAAELIDRDFAAPKKEDVALLAQQLKEQIAKPADASKAVAVSAPAAGSKAEAKGNWDMDALQKAADVETLKAPKDSLVASFTDAYKNGKALYAKATPGSEGNQENLSKALEQFVKAESIYARLENENLRDDDIAENVKEAAMLRYACIKMTILAH